jgi:hypothetical protein
VTDSRKTTGIGGSSGVSWDLVIAVVDDNVAKRRGRVPDDPVPGADAFLACPFTLRQLIAIAEAFLTLPTPVRTERQWPR